MKRQAGIAFRLFFHRFLFIEEKPGSMQAAVSQGRAVQDSFLPECLISCPLAGQQQFFRK